ncbi:MAG TPA: lipopolysaccharide transport periplasmic protein LptA [Rhizomicrobium sp.]|nr:lipopolysaccharide transport periplasmic protein LptA [Rhizomicrobium sp.]
MKRMAGILLLWAAAMPAIAMAADAPGTKTGSLLGNHNTNQPIDIAADKVTANLEEKTVTYTGNVVVTQGDIKMHADAMKVNTDNGKASVIQANGNVVVDSPASGTATGDTGTYDVPNHVVTLTGRKVVLVHNKDISSGTRLSVNLATNVATFVSDKAQGGNGRVQGSFTPGGN